MSETKRHGIVRIILTIVGLNGLVVAAWLALLYAIGTNAMRPRTGSLSLPRFDVDWPGSMGIAFSWMVMLALLGILLAIAAWRVHGRSQAPSSH
jgi:hypothetical protein